ncbi:MAG TPA: AsmA family protein [Mesorhizobium sp.]
MPSPLVRRGIWTIGIAVVVAALAFMALPYLASTRIVRDRIAWEMGAWSGYRVTIEGRPHIVIWPKFRAVLSDVTLSDWARPDDPPVLQAESVEIDLSAMAALRGDVVFSTARLIRPTLRLKPAEKGLLLPAIPSGGRFARSIDTARALVAADANNPDVSKLPADPFGTVEFTDGRVVALAGGKDTDVATGLNGRVNWAALNGGGQFSATGIWRGESIAVDMASAKPLLLFGGGIAPASVSLKAAPATFSFEGNASLSQNAYLDGAVKFSAPSVRRALDWLQAGIAPGAAIGAVSFSSKVTAGSGRVKFDNAQIALNNNPGTGALDFSFTEARPVMAGTLAFDTLDLSAFLSAFTPLALPGGQDAKDTDASFANRLDLDLRLSAAHAMAGTVQLADVAATAQVKNGLAVFDISDATAFGGNVQASVRLDRKPQGTEAEIRLLAADVNGASFGAAAGMTRLVPTGTGTVSLILKGPGKAWDSILESADGSISATFGAGTLTGLNLPAFLKRSQQGGFFALDDVADGTVPVDGVELKATISKGVARIDKAEANSAKSKIWLTGIVPYAGRGLALSGGIIQPNQTAPADNGQAPTTPSQASFFVGGTWTTPFISPIKTGVSGQ